MSNNCSELQICGIFEKLWNDISDRTGICNITMIIENFELDIFNTFAVYSRINRESYIKVLNTPLKKSVNIDYNLICNLISEFCEEQTKIEIEIDIDYEEHFGNFKYFQIDPNEWELEELCICGHKETYVKKNNDKFIFKINIISNDVLSEPHKSC